MFQGTWKTPVETKGAVTVPVAGGRHVARFVVSGTEMDLSVAMKSGQVEYATSVFGEGLITLSVGSGNGSMEVAYE
jgi:hypothetical protein